MTIPAVLSNAVQDTPSRNQKLESLKAAGIVCKAFWRHGGWDGHVYERTVRDVVYWVAVLECFCGTTRVTKYEPETWVQVGSHTYKHGPHYPTDRSQEECRIEWLNTILVLEEENR